MFHQAFATQGIVDTQALQDRWKLQQQCSTERERLLLQLTTNR